MTTTHPSSHCPLCRQPTKPEWRPFCSRYCKNIDLKRWLNEEYAIPEDSKPKTLPPEDSFETDDRD